MFDGRAGEIRSAPPHFAVRTPSATALISMIEAVSLMRVIHSRGGCVPRVRTGASLAWQRPHPVLVQTPIVSIPTAAHARLLSATAESRMSARLCCALLALGLLTGWRLQHKRGETEDSGTT